VQQPWQANTHQNSTGKLDLGCEQTKWKLEHQNSGQLLTAFTQRSRIRSLNEMRSQQFYSSKWSAVLSNSGMSN